MRTTSVCLPTYNSERFVGPALRSILGQSYRSFELIVSDDHSTDRTREVIEAINDPRLKLHLNDRRLGLVANWNQCVDLASGEYLAIFHHDDMMQPDYVRRMTQTLDRHPEVGFVFSNVATIDSDGKAIGGHWNSRLPEVDTLFRGEELFRLLLKEGNLVPCQTVMVRSRCFVESGKFDGRLRYTPDLEMWLRLALRYDVAYVAEPLVLLRRHTGQESSRFLGRVQEVDEVWRAFNIVFTEQRSLIPEAETLYGLAMNHLRRWSYLLLRRNLRNHRLGTAREYASRLIAFWHAERQGLSGLKPLATC